MPSLRLLLGSATTLAVAATVLAPATARADVTPHGEFITDIPIDVPSLRGVAPSVRLTYSSSGGDGTAGVGWSLDAGSRITRTAGPNGGVPAGTPAASDGFLLDGQPLVPCVAGSRSPSCTTAEHTRSSSAGFFSTERESFVRIEHQGDLTPFTLTHRNGHQTRYQTLDGGLTWLAVHSQDLHGNGVDYEYGCAPGFECELQAIRWGDATYLPPAEVRFYYENRPDITQRATGLGFVQSVHRLRSIAVRAGGALARAYALVYSPSSSSQRSMLETVQKFGRDASVDPTTGAVTAGPTPPMPLTRYSAVSGNAGYRAGGQIANVSFAIGDLPGVGPVPRHYDNTSLPDLSTNDLDDEIHPLPHRPLVGDFDGDGRADVVDAYVGQYCRDIGMQGRLTRKASSAGLTADVVIKYRGPITDCDPQFWVADVDGDHRDDVLTRFGNRLWVSQVRGSQFRPAGDSAWTDGTANCSIIDVDGDQRDDLVCFAPDGGSAKIITARSRGDGSFARSVHDPGVVLPVNTPMATGDVNADGFADVVLAVPGSTYQLYTFKGIGQGLYASETAATPWPVGTNDQLVGVDLDADGLTDFMLTRASAGTDARFAMTLGGGSARYRFGSIALAGTPYFGDVDADGKVDLVSRTDLTARIGDGTGSFGSAVQAFPIATCAEAFLADTDGDGRSDLVCVKDDATQTPATIVIDDYPSMRPLRDPHRWLSGDFDGDGQGDYAYVYARNPGVGVTTVLTSGLPRRVPWQFAPSPGRPGLDDSSATHWLVADVGGGPGGAADGKDDLVMVDTDGSTLRVYTLVSKGDGNYAVSVDTPWRDENGNVLPYTDSDLGNFWPSDQDLDGRMDLVHVVDIGSSARVELLRSLGDGTWASSATAYSFPGSAPLVGASDFRPMDVNADGVTDLVHLQAGPAITGTEVRVLFGRGDATFRPVLSNLAMTFPDVARWRTFDANGDGLTDLVHVNSLVTPTGSGLDIQVALARGDGTFVATAPTTAWLPAASAEVVRGLEATSTIIPMELDGNGLTDLLHLSRYRDSAGNDRTLVVQVRNPGTGTAWTAYANTFGAAVPAAPPWAWRPVRDTTRPDSAGIAWLDGVAGQTLFYDRPSDRLGTIDNGNGGSTAIAYEPILARRDYLPSGMVPVVTKTVTRTDSTYVTPKVEETTYSYDGARWSDARGRMLGFAWVGARSPRIYTMTAYTTDEHCAGNVSRVSTYDAQTLAMYSYTVVDLHTPTGAAPYQCLARREHQYSCADGQCRHETTAEWVRDAFGNNVVYTEQATGAPTRTTTAPVIPNEVDYIVDQPSSREITADDGTGPQVLSNDLFLYDGNPTHAEPPGKKGELRRVKSWDSQAGTYVDTVFEYDAHGMLEASTSPTGVRTTKRYDATYGAYPVLACDPVGCVTNAWDMTLGTLVAVWDLNGQATTTHTDAFGRIDLITRADGSTVRTKLLELGTAGRQRQRVEVADTSSDGVLWTERYLDGWGRTYRSETENGAGQVTDFDGLSGRPLRVSLPFPRAGSPSRWTAYSYDGLGRPLAVTSPDGKQRTWNYELGKVTAWDQIGQPRSLYLDGLGQVTRVTEYLNGAEHDTTYGYDGAGRLVGTRDAIGNVTSYYFDTLGRLVASSDPDRGLRELVYAPGGPLQAAYDASGQRTSFEYDTAGRGITRRELGSDGSERTVKWIYDRIGTVAQGASIGRLVGIDDDQGRIMLASRFSYDAMGRVTDESECIDGMCMPFRRGFDITGRLASLQYPDANGQLDEIVHYTYDEGGRLDRVGDYVKATRYTADGRIDYTEYGNGTVTDYTYDPQRLWTTDLEVRSPATARYTAHYEHDGTGRIEQLDEESPFNRDTFVYDYDDLGRLEDVRSTDPSLERHLEYDEIGRIVASSQWGAFQYDDPAHVHAVTSTSMGNVRQYDKNGNTTRVHDPSGRGLRIDWTVDARPRRIDDGSATYEMVYDAQGSRVMKSGGTTTDLYFGSLVAVEGGRFTKYYFAGDRLIARDNGKRFYYHGDHTNSTRIESDERGDAANVYQYDVAGALVRQREGSEDDVRYGGVHGDEELGLTYLSARYYDPTLMRFLSPDSVVPDAFAPQSLDRYAYVQSDPVNYWDPTGHMRKDIELMMENKRAWRALMVSYEEGINICNVPDFCTYSPSETRVHYGVNGHPDVVVQPGSDPAIARWGWGMGHTKAHEAGASKDHGATASGESGDQSPTREDWIALAGPLVPPGPMFAALDGGSAAEDAVEVKGEIMEGDADKPLKRDVEVEGPIVEDTAAVMFGVSATLQVSLDKDGKIVGTPIVTPNGAATVKLEGVLQAGRTAVVTAVVTSTKERVDANGGTANQTQSDEKQVKVGVNGKGEKSDGLSETYKKFFLDIGIDGTGTWGGGSGQGTQWNQEVKTTAVNRTVIWKLSLPEPPPPRRSPCPPGGTQSQGMPRGYCDAPGYNRNRR